MNVSTTLVLCAAFLCGPSFAQPVVERSGPPGTTQQENGILEVLEKFIAAWNRHDAKAFAAVFAEDADFTNVLGAGARGRAGVESFHAPLFAGQFKDTRQTITAAKIRFVRPDVAAVDARWEMTGARTPQGADIPMRRGLLSFVMTTRPGDGWVITVMHNMNLPTAP